MCVTVVYTVCGPAGRGAEDQVKARERQGSADLERGVGFGVR